MAKLTAAVENKIPSEEFALVYTNKNGETIRKLPIHDANHVRNVLARFNQTDFPDDYSRKRAMAKIKAAAARFGIE